MSSPTDRPPAKPLLRILGALVGAGAIAVAVSDFAHHKAQPFDLVMVVIGVGFLAYGAVGNRVRRRT